MSLPKRVSLWTMVDVFDWVKEKHPYQKSVLQLAIVKHDISGPPLLMMGEHQLERMGVKGEHLQDILLDILRLRVQEKLENINIFSGEGFYSLLLKR
ncbi:sterile alpha motif domain-containing protein 12-like isoform X1 [Oncorhynchus tshawytscha]|uniref:sterile alpha motif domain-containing protein 12-like isoform X1 n=1 Tax=Oncorhynchus tshawytscha TaxID=74940 RepID=UPI001C3E649D|nr:sterile alpha motif domain-containing protein 12-like isoform X1 [Oncorhynchus tshawytscha]